MPLLLPLLHHHHQSSLLVPAGKGLFVGHMPFKKTLRIESLQVSWKPLKSFFILFFSSWDVSLQLVDQDIQADSQGCFLTGFLELFTFIFISPLILVHSKNG